MTDETSPAPAAEPGAAELAVAVHQRTDELTPGPVPWAALERRHRRGTLRRGSLALAGVVAAAAAVLVAVTSGIGPLSATSEDVVPAGPWPGDPVLSAGSPWADGLMERVSSTIGARPGATRTLMYAADVDDARIALVRVRDGSDILWWLVGPVGASPERMSVDGGVDPGRAYSTVLPPTGTSPRRATVLVLGPPGAQLSVWTNDDVTRDGWATSPKLPGHEIADGVYTARLTVPFNHAHVELRGLPGREWGEFVSREDVQPPAVRDTEWWAAGAAGIRGDTGAGPPSPLQIRTIYNQLALPSQVPGGRVLWTMQDGRNRQSAVALRAPSGGWVVAAIRTEPREYGTDGGYTEGSAVVAAAPRPDGDPDRLAFAWYLDTTVDPDGKFWPAGDRLVVVGPRAAASVRLMGGSETIPNVPLSNGAALIRRDSVGKVEFLDAQGRSLGETEVTPPWQSNARLPGIT